MKCKLVASLELTSGVAFLITLTDARGLHPPPYIALLTSFPAPRIPSRKTSQTNNETTSFLSCRESEFEPVIQRADVRIQVPARRRDAMRTHDTITHLRPVDTDGSAAGITPRAVLLPSEHRGVAKDVETYTCMLNLLPLLQPPEREGSIMRVQRYHCPPTPSPAALPDSVPSIGCASTRPAMVPSRLCIPTFVIQ